ncbi:hypothetical protein LNV23_05835 [Paucibacter sp. DJ1R-11]|uniref:hypothetical protein n=1 Tax=Paucibacter sp. DJ1R-11 TaxID=2893556 RepID=UPI0021E39F99|nr:hypothetical protein [Paucibacter sp. DJ1R-11]MCV2362972.1 hypothetical protein [Paucibacter sp. DJ1R-11]
MLLAAPQALTDPIFIGLSSLLVFFAALPWVNFALPGRSLGLAGVFFAIGIAALGIQTAAGAVSLQHACGRRYSVLCELDKLLFLLGGELLAATPFATCALFLLAGSVRLVLQHPVKGLSS